jgi:hypothetical protein
MNEYLLVIGVVAMLIVLRLRVGSLERRVRKLEGSKTE